MKMTDCQRDVTKNRRCEKEKLGGPLWNQSNLYNIKLLMIIYRSSASVACSGRTEIDPRSSVKEFRNTCPIQTYPRDATNGPE